MEAAGLAGQHGVDLRRHDGIRRNFILPGDSEKTIEDRWVAVELAMAALGWADGVSDVRPHSGLSHHFSGRVI